MTWLKRILHALAIGFAALVTFVLALAGAVLLHLDVPASRRVVAAQANAVLAGILCGDVRVERIDHLGLGGLSGVRVRVRDPVGVPVLDAAGVRVDVATGALVRSLLANAPLRVDVRRIAIESADVSLDGDAAGGLRLANAFAPRSSEADGTAPPPTPPAENPNGGVRVDAPSVRIAHAWVHRAAAPLDVDLYRLAGTARVDTANVGLVRAELTELGLVARALPRGLDPRGNITGRFEMPLGGAGATNGAMNGEVLFEGTVAGMATTIAGGIAGNEVHARVDVLDASGKNARTVTETGIHEELSLHAVATGSLATAPSTAHHFEATARLFLGPATVDLTGAATLGSTTHLEGRLAARHVDLSAIEAAAPRSDIGIDAHGNVVLGQDGGLDGIASLATAPSRIAGQDVPRIDVVGRFRGEAIHLRARTAGNLEPRGPAMPVEIFVDAEPRPGVADGRTIDAAVRATIPELRRLPVVGRSVSGSAEVEAQGRLLLPEKTLAATATVLGQNLAPPSVRIAALRVDARAEGTVDRPQVDAEVHAERVTASGFDLATVDASAAIDPGVGGELTVRDASLTALPANAANEPPVRVAARRLHLLPSRIDLEGARIDGVGEPITADAHVDGRRGRGRIEAKVDAPSIDLVRVARFAGKPDVVRSGTLSFAVEGLFDDGDASGRFHAALARLSSSSIPNGEAEIDANIEGHRVAIDAQGHVDDIGKISLQALDLEVPGKVADAASWKGVHGKTTFEGEVDLARLRSLLPRGTIPLSETAGEIAVQGRIARDGPKSPPEIAFHLHTLGLVVAGGTDRSGSVGAVRVRTRVPWRSNAVDVGFDFRNDGTSGFTNVAFRATDAKGPILSLDAKTELPYGEILANPAVLLDRVLAAPIAVKLNVPPRKLSELPSVLGVSTSSGAVDADLDVDGTVLDPRVHLVAHGRGLETPEAKGLVVDSDLHLDYDGETAKLALAARRKDQPMLDVTTEVVGRARAAILAAMSGGPTPDWHASARAKVVDLPLAALPVLQDHHVRGRLDGEVVLDDLHRDAAVRGRLSFANLAVGRTVYKSGVVTVDAEKGKLVATARLDQQEGYLDARAGTALRWGAALAPTFDLDRAEARVVAQRFSAKIAQPFLPDAVPTLDGLIDADVRAALDGGKTRLRGKLSFHDGRVQIAALGEEMRQVHATVTITPDGAVAVRDVSAKGTRGEISGHADAKLDGLRLVEANGAVEIPKRHPLDVALQGAPLGAIFGSVAVKAKTQEQGNKTTIAVEVPKMTVELPQITKTGVQALDEDKDKKDQIRVGTYRRRNVFVELPLKKEDTVAPAEAAKENAEASRLELDVALGDITVTRGNTARVSVTGHPKVVVVSGDASPGAQVTGEVHTTKGWVDVRGKRFDIDRASVVFNGDSPPDPVITATATWQAADGTHVFVDFVGPVKTGKVTMRSEPPLPRDEILALVLFGATEGANPSGGSSSAGDTTTNTAVGVGGGIAAQGLTEALDNLAGIQATARIDTTMANNPRPELEVQISPKISVGYAHVVGTPPITQPDLNLANFEWRFHPRWSLDTTVGDHGTALVDAIWQKHY